MATYAEQIQQKIHALDLPQRWELLLDRLAGVIGKRPENLDTVLFLIGVQELGQGAKTFTKEQKQDLMHIAICRLLSGLGFYTLIGHDQDGWPHWEAAQSPPALTLEEQELLLKMQAWEYFAEMEIV